MNNHADKNLIKFEVIKKSDLSKDNFFGDLLLKCYDNKIIDEKLAQRINNDRLANLQTLLKYYTKNESSSVMAETAESLLKCLDYTIGVYLKQFDTIEEILNKLKNENLETMLKKGNRLIKLNVEYSKKLLKKVQMNKLNVHNYSYDDTVDYGIDKFFKTYDDFFCAQGGDSDIDYQLAIDIGDYLGVEYIRYYLERLDMENEFCHHFDEENIKKLLYGYDTKSELLLLNIFEIILTNCIGLVLCNNDITTLNITKNDKEIIKDSLISLSNEELKECIQKACHKIIETLSIDNEDLILYINQCCAVISDQISDGIKYGNVNNIFISFREKEDKKIIEYIDKEKLNNKSFRKLTEKIRSAQSINKKLELINDNIKSLADLNDMLDSECLFDAEYNAFFRNLSKMQLVLLSKYIDVYGDKKHWHDKFYAFIESMTEKDKANIIKIKKQILLS